MTKRWIYGFFTRFTHSKWQCLSFLPRLRLAARWVATLKLYGYFVALSMTGFSSMAKDAFFKCLSKFESVWNFANFAYFLNFLGNFFGFLNFGENFWIFAWIFWNVLKIFEFVWLNLANFVNFMLNLWKILSLRFVR